MDRRFAYQDSLQDRIAEGIEGMRIALDQQALSLALAAAREAARSALLALGQAPGRVGKRDLALLREAATATPQRFANRPDEREVLSRATLELLGRLFADSSAPRRRALASSRFTPEGHAGAARCPDPPHSDLPYSADS
ncbi:hypothetical protein [Dankookia sp. P2]|uniref:hypothetical protein n=1 Tax=Dankookia sp. P2 TaxID=3423955 RepID=UPI003D66A4AF